MNKSTRLAKKVDQIHPSRFFVITLLLIKTACKLIHSFQCKSPRAVMVTDGKPDF